jgi:hypothetical protein
MSEATLYKGNFFQMTQNREMFSYKTDRENRFFSAIRRRRII